MIRLGSFTDEGPKSAPAAGRGAFDRPPPPEPEVSVRSPSNRAIRRWCVLATLIAIGPGCGPNGDSPDLATSPAPPPGDPEAARAIQDGLTILVNRAEERFHPLIYDYDEGLLEIADREEAGLSDAGAKSPARFMPKLDEAEEKDHFRETIRRWEAERGGPSFRAAIVPLIAEVAARKPGASTYPDFHKRFSLVFDSFIAIEVLEAHERRNRAIREEGEALLAPYREKEPRLVVHFEKMLDRQFPRAPTATGSPTK